MMTTPSSRARRPARPAPRRLRDGAAALTAAGLLTAAALTGSEVAPVAAAAAITARITPIAWHACPVAPSLDCATYPVPLDYADRADGTVDLTLYRHPATDPAHRIGTLFVNPGGPGDSTFKMTEKIVATSYPGLAARFDILGMDPRGVGASTPIQCFPTDAAREQALATFMAVPLTPAETSTDARVDHAFNRACAANAGALLAHMSTADVARDLDTLRQALGESQLTYLGQSYGTLLGATYANLFPGRVRAMVLDAMVDPAARTGDSLAYEKQRAVGFESMLDAFLGACQRAAARCAFSAGNPAEKFGILRARVWQGPLALPDGTTMDASRLWNWFTEGIPNPGNWPDLAAYLQQVYQAAITSPAHAAADGTARAAGSAQSQAYSYNSSDAFSAINCADEQLPRTPGDWPQIASRFEQAAPTFGRGQAYSALPCATWPVTTDRYAGPWNQPTAHTLLIVANLHDPATPYQMAIRASHELANARLLTIDGFGHTSSGESACATQDVTTYLTTGQLPPPGTVCQPDTQPFH